MITILVADDDHKLLNMLRRTLSYAGFRVVTACDGQEALVQVEAERPEAIVLDWMMPKLDGSARCSTFASTRRHSRLRSASSSVWGSVLPMAAGRHQTRIHRCSHQPLTHLISRQALSHPGSRMTLPEDI